MIRFHPRTVLSRTTAAVLVSIFGLALAGCGGGSGDTEPAALTKAQFIKQGDAICARVDKKQSSGASAYIKAHPDVEEERSVQEKFLVAVGLPPIRKAIEELESLTPPPADKREVETILAEMEVALQKSVEKPISVLTGKNDPFEKANESAAKYGLTVCSKFP
jgi:hypothetical protein